MHYLVKSSFPKAQECNAWTVKIGEGSGPCSGPRFKVVDPTIFSNFDGPGIRIIKIEIGTIQNDRYVVQFNLTKHIPSI
jgi:hypothetical protein